MSYVEPFCQVESFSTLDAWKRQKVPVHLQPSALESCIQKKIKILLFYL